MDEDKVAVRAEDAAAHAGRGDRRRRRVPRPVGRRRAQAGRWWRRWRRDPLIFALANPTPEILPEEVKAVRDDAIIATGRTDYPNQVNNVLCFPYIFRGALDCGRDDDHRRDGDRRGARHRRAGAGRAERGGGRGLCRRDAELRPRVPDPQALRPAADDEDRAGRGAGRRRLGRGAAADHRLGRLPREAAELRLRLGHDDEADLQRWPSAPGTSAWPTPRARKSACCARCRWWSTKAWRGRR